MYKEILQSLQKKSVKLLAVSKTKSVTTIQKFYDKGQRDFGENRVQEMVEKHAQLPQDINWHLIGHLQRNKVKYIVQFVHLIHSVDSLRLAKKINEEASKINRTVDILVQIEISDEKTKFGWNYHDFIESKKELLDLENIRLVGFMGMAKNTTDEDIIREEFQEIKSHFKKFKSIINQSYFTELSIGMSSDYLIAVEEGATIVRIGSLIFGSL